ncbi:hypothetical protein ABT214_03430 [Micromonospora purpureochromogenes]|uniref:hypothetical protein n=1 Tax=Micromonospora purpureochromogenes TaxID=47872 RepID=UPI0033260974
MADWTAYGAARINVVSWPVSAPVVGGLVGALWVIETLDDVTAGDDQALRRLNLNRLTSQMSFQLKVSGRRRLDMTCVCDGELEMPYRLGAASLAWRAIDENVLRLWMIGNAPRVHYPVFMQQRRELVSSLDSVAQQVWLWLSMIRCEPLMAAAVGQESQAVRLLELLRKLDVIGVSAYFSRMASKLDYVASLNTNLPELVNLEEVLPLLREAVASATGSAYSDLVNASCYASERLFDALFSLDQAFGTVTSAGFAAAEDVAWFNDCLKLRFLREEILAEVVGAAAVESSRLLQFSVEKGLAAGLRPS